MASNEITASEVQEEPEEGEIVDDFEFIISSEEEYSMRKRIKELEERNDELERIAKISGNYDGNNSGFDKDKDKDYVVLSSSCETDRYYSEKYAQRSHRNGFDDTDYKQKQRRPSRLNRRDRHRSYEKSAQRSPHCHPHFAHPYDTAKYSNGLSYSKSDEHKDFRSYSSFNKQQHHRNTSASGSSSRYHHHNSSSGTKHRSRRHSRDSSSSSSNSSIANSNNNNNDKEKSFGYKEHRKRSKHKKSYSSKYKRKVPAESGGGGGGGGDNNNHHSKRSKASKSHSRHIRSSSELHYSSPEDSSHHHKEDNIIISSSTSDSDSDSNKGKHSKRFAINKNDLKVALNRNCDATIQSKQNNSSAANIIEIDDSPDVILLPSSEAQDAAASRPEKQPMEKPLTEDLSVDSLEENELRLIALKSAYVKKHMKRKAREAQLAYSPTDFEKQIESDKDVASGDKGEAQKNELEDLTFTSIMDISPLVSPKHVPSPTSTLSASEEEGGGQEEGELLKNDRNTRNSLASVVTRVVDTKPVDMDIETSRSSSAIETQDMCLDSINLPNSCFGDFEKLQEGSKDYFAGAVYASFDKYSDGQDPFYIQDYREIPPPPPPFTRSLEFVHNFDDNAVDHAMPDKTLYFLRSATNISKTPAAETPKSQKQKSSSSNKSGLEPDDDESVSKDEEIEALRALLISKIANAKAKAKQESLIAERRNDNPGALILKDAVRRIKGSKEKAATNSTSAASAHLKGLKVKSHLELFGYEEELSKENVKIDDNSRDLNRNIESSRSEPKTKQPNEQQKEACDIMKNYTHHNVVVPNGNHSVNEIEIDLNNINKDLIEELTEVLEEQMPLALENEANQSAKDQNDLLITANPTSNQVSAFSLDPLMGEAPRGIKASIDGDEMPNKLNNTLAQSKTTTNAAAASKPEIPKKRQASALTSLSSVSPSKESSNKKLKASASSVVAVDNHSKSISSIKANTTPISPIRTPQSVANASNCIKINKPFKVINKKPLTLNNVVAKPNLLSKETTPQKKTPSRESSAGTVASATDSSTAIAKPLDSPKSSAQPAGTPSSTRLLTSTDIAAIKVSKLVIPLNGSDSESGASLQTDSSESINDSTNDATSNKYFDNASPLSLPLDSASNTPQRIASPSNDAESNSASLLASVGFEQKVESFLKSIRSKCESNTHSNASNTTATKPNLEISSSPNTQNPPAQISHQPPDVPITPLAVRHLPPNAQDEYRRLVHRMKLLEKQKESKNTTSSSSSSSSQVTENQLKQPQPQTQQQKSSLIRQVLVKNTEKPVASKSKEKEGSGGGGGGVTPTLTVKHNDAKQSKSQTQMLKELERDFYQVSGSLMWHVEKNLQLVSLAKKAKVNKLCFQKRIEDLRREIKELEDKEGVEKRKMAQLQPEIRSQNFQIGNFKEQLKNIVKMATIVGKEVHGVDFRLQHPRDEELKQKLDLLSKNIRNVNNIQDSEIQEFLKDFEDKRKESLPKQASGLASANVSEKRTDLASSKSLQETNASSSPIETSLGPPGSSSTVGGRGTDAKKSSGEVDGADEAMSDGGSSSDSEDNNEILKIYDEAPTEGDAPILPATSPNKKKEVQEDAGRESDDSRKPSPSANDEVVDRTTEQGQPPPAAVESASGDADGLTVEEMFEAFEPQASTFQRYSSVLGNTQDTAQRNLNPFNTICPFEVHGQCIDEDCEHEHFKKNILDVSSSS